MTDVLSDTAVFARRYLAHAASQLPGRDPVALAALATSAQRFGAIRQWGQTLLRITAAVRRTPTTPMTTSGSTSSPRTRRTSSSRCAPNSRAWAGPRSCVLHPQTRAQPRRGRRDHQRLRHRRQRRRARGRDGRVLGAPRGRRRRAGRTRRSSPPDLERVLDDVLHARADAPHMYGLIRKLADQLCADPGHFDRETSVEAGELLRWLADGNFMILGHAAYSANDLAKPARTRPRRQRLGGAARYRPHLAAGAAAGLPQRGAADDLQVAAGVDRAALGALRLRHRGDPGGRHRAADDPRLPRPDQQRGGRPGVAGAGAAPAHRRDPAALRRARRQPHRATAAGRAAHPAARRTARGADRRPAPAGPAGRRPGRPRHRRRVRPHPPQPRLRQRARLLPGRPLRPGDPAQGHRRSSRGTGPGRSSAATTASSSSGWPACSC